MAKRGDTLPPIPNPVGLRIDLAPATRDGLRAIAAAHGYSMAAFLRALIERTVADPKPVLKILPKKSEYQG